MKLLSFYNEIKNLIQLQVALANEYNVAPDEVAVDNVVVVAGSKKGDGFVCDIAAVQFRASFDGRHVEKSYIAKYAPEGRRDEMVRQVRSEKNNLV